MCSIETRDAFKIRMQSNSQYRCISQPLQQQQQSVPSMAIQWISITINASHLNKLAFFQSLAWFFYRSSTDVQIPMKTFQNCAQLFGFKIDDGVEAVILKRMFHYTYRLCTQSPAPHSRNCYIQTGQKLFLRPFLPFILFIVIFSAVVAIAVSHRSFVRSLCACIEPQPYNLLKWLKNARRVLFSLASAIFLPRFVVLHSLELILFVHHIFCL